MGWEPEAIAAWLKQTLSPVAPAGGVYKGLLPEGGPYPALRFEQRGGTDSNTMGGSRAPSRQFWTVEAVGQGSSTVALAAIMTQVDPLLQGVRVPLEGFMLTWARVRTLDYIEVKGQMEFRHVGGVYRATLSQRVG